MDSFTKGSQNFWTSSWKFPLERPLQSDLRLGKSQEALQTLPQNSRLLCPSSIIKSCSNCSYCVSILSVPQKNGHSTV